MKLNCFHFNLDEGNKNCLKDEFQKRIRNCTKCKNSKHQNGIRSVALTSKIKVINRAKNKTRNKGVS